MRILLTARISKSYRESSNNQENVLSFIEKALLSSLMNEVPTEVEGAFFETDDIAEAVIEKRRLEMSQKTNKSSFIRSKFILPTSNLL